MSNETNTNINIKPGTIITVVLGIVVALLGWAFKELYTGQRESVSAADEVLAEQIERVDKRVDKVWEKFGDLKDDFNEYRVNHRDN